MDKEFYAGKIEQLSDEKLKELLRLKNKENLEIMIIAEREAIRRGIDLPATETEIRKAKIQGAKPKAEEGISWKYILGEILSGLSNYK